MPPVSRQAMARIYPSSFADVRIDDGWCESQCCIGKAVMRTSAPCTAYLHCAAAAYGWLHAGLRESDAGLSHPGSTRRASTASALRSNISPARIRRMQLSCRELNSVMLGEGSSPGRTPLDRRRDESTRRACGRVEGVVVHIPGGKPRLDRREAAL